MSDRDLSPTRGQAPAIPPPHPPRAGQNRGLVVVLGSELSALRLAGELHRAGEEVHVVEPSRQPGQLLATHTDSSGFTWDAMPAVLAGQTDLATASGDGLSEVRWLHTASTAGDALRFAARFLTQPNVKAIGRRNLLAVDKLTNPADYGGMLYPSSGGLGSLVARELKHLPDEALSLGVAIHAVDLPNRRIHVEGRWLSYSRLISALPLDVLLAIAALSGELPRDVQAAADSLTHTSAVFACLGVRPAPEHRTLVPWRRFANDDVPFTRVARPRALCAAHTPPRADSLVCEWVYASDAVQRTDSAILGDSIDALVALGELTRADVDHLCVRRVHRHSRYCPLESPRASAVLLPFLAEHDVTCTGPLGLWDLGELIPPLTATRGDVRAA